MIFRKGGGKRIKTTWHWGEEELEEVNSFKYLGYNFQANNKADLHIQELTKKGYIVMKQIWGIGKRRFEQDFERRMFMFNYLVKSIVLYGAEIFGWNEHKKLETIQEKYIRWCLELDRNTPSYMILAETGMNKLKIDAGRRAVNFEKKIRTKTENLILKECIRELDKLEKPERGWCKLRKEFYEANGIGKEEVIRRMTEGQDVATQVSERSREIQMQHQDNKIRSAKYCERYVNIRSRQDRAVYLCHRGRNKKQTILCRFRCGCEERASRYWEKEDRKMCRICGRTTETLEHLTTDCTEDLKTDWTINDILNEEGLGLQWLRKLIKKRQEIEDKE